MLHIVDDDADLRESLLWMAMSRQIPAASYASGEDFLAVVDPSLKQVRSGRNKKKIKYNFDPNGDCVLLDVRMGGLSGVATFEHMIAKRLSRRIPVIFITGHGDVPMAVDVLKHGAFDFFEKPYDDNALFDCVEKAFLASIDAGKLAAVYDRLDDLTLREREVLNLILVGKMNKVIADDLGISMRTVEVHRANIFDKMEVKTAVELAGMLK